LLWLRWGGGGWVFGKYLRVVVVTAAAKTDVRQLESVSCFHRHSIWLFCVVTCAECSLRWWAV
jgi:hypothetical protein